MVAINPAESANETNTENEVTFRWTYIMVPAVLLLLSLILTTVFYRLLPTEVAYHFQNGTPDRWISRTAIIAWLVIPQVFCTLFAFTIVRTAIFTTRYWSAEGTPLKKFLPVMGNMVILPQVILIFAMLDIFLYNAYQIKLMPLWVFALIVMVLGGLVLGILLIQTYRQFRRLHSKSLRE